MKILLLLTLSLSLSLSALSQDRWKLHHGGKILVQAVEENEAKNKATLTVGALKKSGFLLVNYTEEEKPQGWQRYIAVYDASDNELFQKPTASLKIQNTQLRTWSKKAKKLKIYSWSLPTDPQKAALVRVRRVHLATLTIQ
jgi:hypothetical protein